MGYDKATLVKRIIYTASLVSSIDEVDGYLDRLRAITAQADFLPENMSDQQYAILTSLQQQLETYLIEREPLRSFTSESLQIQIEQHLTGNQEALQGSREIGLILGITAVTIALLAVLPLSIDHLQQRFVLMGAVAAGIMNLGGAWLLLSALSAFKSQLRKAFILICLGAISFAAAILLQPFIELLELRATSDIEVFFVMPMILLSAVLIYLGSARYARLTEVKSWFLSLKAMLIVSVLVSIALLAAPHHTAQDSALALGISAALHGGVVLFSLATIVLLAKMIPRVADLYKQPVRALLQAIVFMLAVVLFVTGTVASSGPRLSNSMALFAFSILLLIGGMLMRAGYSFKKISRY